MPCVSELSVLPPGEGSSVDESKMQTDGFTGRDSWEVAAMGRPVLSCTLGSLRLG